MKGFAAGLLGMALLAAARASEDVPPPAGPATGKAAPSLPAKSAGASKPSAASKGLKGPLLPSQVGGHSPRFERAYPLSGMPSVMIDMALDGQGLALQAARSKRLQARILWIDCTANIERYNDDEKIRALIAQVKAAGFNTIVFDVKPISGHVAYPSKLAPKLTEWKDRILPPDFDPLRPMLREAKAAGLWFFVSLNALSEGHRDFKVGPGYGLLDQQTVLYEPDPHARIGSNWFPISPAPNEPPPNGDRLFVVTSEARKPEPRSGLFAVSVSKTGSIVDGFESGGVAPRVPTIPQGGSLVYGTGSAGNWLRTHALPGRSLAFDSKALYVPISERPEQQIPLMMNPHHPKVQERALAVLKELAANYAIDGVIYDDRLRYAGLNADFSIWTRAEFEQHVGRPLNWPDDVYRYRFTPDFTRGLVAGPYYQKWLTWRAATLQDFVSRVRKTLEAVRPGIQFGVYAGSWYGEYAGFGSNYGAKELEAGFWYLTSDYRKTGFAPLLDFLITGCYYPTATIHDALANGSSIGYTIEYAGYLSNQVARDQTWTYAGIMLSQFVGNPEGLIRALQASCASTQGVMVFDLSHGIEEFWPVFARAFSSSVEPPHANRALLAEVRRKRSLVDQAIAKRGPVVIASGQPGAGH